MEQPQDNNYSMYAGFLLILGGIGGMFVVSLPLFYPLPYVGIILSTTSIIGGILSFKRIHWKLCVIFAIFGMIGPWMGSASYFSAYFSIFAFIFCFSGLIVLLATKKEFSSLLDSKKQEIKPTKEIIISKVEKPKPKKLYDYDTDEKCPSCSYQFTNYATIEPKQKTLEVICPHCHHTYKKRITKKPFKK